MTTYFPNRRAFVEGSAAAAIATLETSQAALAQSSDVERKRARHVQTARDFLELLHRKDIDAWGELWADNGRIIVFYPPEGFGTSIDGKAAILAGFRDLLAHFASFDYELTGLYPAADSDAVVIEYRPRIVLTDGTVYTNSNIAVFRFEDGLISAYHDYFDPRRFQVVVDAVNKG
jgi:ketosteroid isomerase-like protein